MSSKIRLLKYWNTHPESWVQPCCILVGTLPSPLNTPKSNWSKEDFIADWYLPGWQTFYCVFWAALDQKLVLFQTVKLIPKRHGMIHVNIIMKFVKHFWEKIPANAFVKKKVWVRDFEESRHGCIFWPKLGEIQASHVVMWYSRIQCAGKDKDFLSDYTPMVLNSQ